MLNFLTKTTNPPSSKVPCVDFGFEILRAWKLILNLSTFAFLNLFRNRFFDDVLEMWKWSKKLVEGGKNISVRKLGSWVSIWIKNIKKSQTITDFDSFTLFTKGELSFQKQVQPLWIQHSRSSICDPTEACFECEKSKMKRLQSPGTVGNVRYDVKLSYKDYKSPGFQGSLCGLWFWNFANIKTCEFLI